MNVVHWEAIPAPSSGRATIVNIATPEQLDLISDLLKPTDGRFSVSIKADPTYRWREDKPIPHWRDWNDIRRIMAHQPNFEYELAFGEQALQSGSEKVFQIIDSCSRHLHSILWREEPELSLMLDIAIRYPNLSQALRLNEVDLSGQMGPISSVLPKWQICGIKQLVIPAQMINSRVYKSFMEVLGTIVNTGFELRLEGYKSSKDDFVRKVVAKHGGPPMDTDIVFSPELQVAIQLRKAYQHRTAPTL